jgi:hypothetical protein
VESGDQEIREKANARQGAPDEQYFRKTEGMTEGYEIYKRAIDGKTADDRDMYFVLAGAKRLRPSAHPLVIRCRGGGRRYCSTAFITRDAKIKASLEWPEDQYPIEKWRDLDLLVQDISAAIFLERAAEDFQ